MADFIQRGNITTFHDLRTKNVAELEKEVLTYSKNRPISLVVPCLYSELAKPALKNIVDELSKVKFLNHIIIGLDKADEKDFRHAKSYFSKLPQRHDILWHDGPRLLNVTQALKKNNLSPPEPGKGRNVWYCFGYALALQTSEVVVLHDADITTYNKDMLTKLVFPVVNPNFFYVFTKGYYPRIHAHMFGGRVVRLLVAPLLQALKKVIGDHEYLSYLQSFRYPLAGEFAMRTSVLSDIRIPSDWGLEIGVLSEIRRSYSSKVISQVEIADTYDHKHQEMSQDDSSKGLSRMSVDISKAIFRKLATDGQSFSQETFRTIKATYFREALDLIESYYDDAKMNGLSIDRNQEEQSVELFAQNIMLAGKAFLENPMETPFMPTWRRINDAHPDFLANFRTAVMEDNY